MSSGSQEPDDSGRRHRVVTSTTIDEAVDRMGALFGEGGWSIAPSRGEFAFRYTETGDASIMLRTIRFTGVLTGVHRGDDYMVIWLKRGSGRVGSDDHVVRAGVGQPVLLAPGGPVPFTFEDFDADGVYIPRRLLENRPGLGPRPLVDQVGVVSPEVGLQAWWEAVRFAGRAFLQGTYDPRIAAQAAEQVVTALIEMFPSRMPPPPTGVVAQAPRTIRAALEYMHANAHRRITAPDIAAAARVSVRGLQGAFQNHLGVSPVSALRSLRLDRARDELLAADGDAGSVSEIARHWGFHHLGRFAGNYAARFGELPSVTLRRGRSGELEHDHERGMSGDASAAPA